MNLDEKPTIATFGETLWDCLESSLFLGGAPFNVAYHAACLSAVALPITSVGRDFLGEQILRRARDTGMDIRLISQHESLRTGVALAEIDEEGNAAYDIQFPAAWDEIALSEADRCIVRQANALVYGSLAARSQMNRETLEAILEDFPGFRVCDVNLRSPYDSIERVRHLAGKADLVKLNETELYRIIGRSPESDRQSREAALRDCAESLDAPTILVTLGGEGALAIHDGQITEQPAVPVKVVDTIGAGDAFTAAFVHAHLCCAALEDCLRAALELGSFVAGQKGAQPRHDSSSSSTD